MSGQEDREKGILVTWSSLPSYKKYMEMIEPIWDSIWLINMRDLHKQLEEELEEHMGIRNMTLFVNGHMALEMATQVLELTGEVTTTPFSFASTTHAIVRNDLTPVFCDTNSGDYTMDSEKIGVLVTDKISATMPIHMYGNLCDAKRTEAIARKRGLKVIYDAAHTFGERYKRKSVAKLGDAGIFSFHVTKVFNSTKGGAVTFKENWVECRLDCLRSFGIADQDHAVWVGGGIKINEFQATMGLYNLHHLGREIGRRKKVAERYLPGLASVSGTKLPSFKEGPTSNYTYFPVLFEGFKADRDQVYDCLAGYRIYPRKYSYPLINDLQCYEGRFSSKDTPVAAYATDHVLTLPCHADLELEDVDRIYDTIRGM